MRYPVDNYKTEWNNSAGYDHGDTTSYGKHDGKDLNDSGGGDSDLGKPLYAIADGTIVGIHSHSAIPSFGKHFFLQIDGVWGTRFVHYAHCNEIFVTEGQKVKEGDKVATVGKSGTEYAHCHFAIKKKANGMDTIAYSQAALDDAWEDPIKFIEQYINAVPDNTDQKTIEELREARDKNWNLYQDQLKVTEQLRDRIQNLEGQVSTCNNEKTELWNANKTLNEKVSQMAQAIEKDALEDHDIHTRVLELEHNLNDIKKALKLPQATINQDIIKRIEELQKPIEQMDKDFDKFVKIIAKLFVALKPKKGVK